MQRRRDVFRFAVCEQNRDELGVGGGVVKMLIDKFAFPSDAESFGRLNFAEYLVEIELGANHQDKFGFADLPLHPLWPAFGRAFLVLINRAVNTIGAETIRQGEHVIRMSL